jgi:hypothetical protein
MTAITLAMLEGEVMGLVGDETNATFTLLQIDDWINQAIRDLSIHFPRISDYTMNTTLGTHVYDMETYIKGVISVEYPTGQNPPRFLSRKIYTDPKFWLSEGYYDFIKPNTSDSLLPPQLYVSDYTPVGTNLISVKCTIDHAPLVDSGDECTVLERHYHLIGLFVRWKALSERSSHESMDPSPLAMRASLMENATMKAEAAYIAALNRALAAENDSGQASWKMDRFDGLY